MLAHRKGFTLLEVLVVLCVLSILAAPTLYQTLQNIYATWQQKSLLQHDVRAILSLLSQARELSIHSLSRVKLCGGIQCDGQWSEVIYLKQDSSSDIIRAQHTFHHDTQIQWRGFPSQRAFILFLSSGLSSYQNGSFYICHQNSQARRVVINQSGRAYLDSQWYDSSECHG